MKQLQRKAQGTDAPRNGAADQAGEVRIRTWLTAIGLLVSPFLFLGLYYKTTFGGLVNPDALDYAQLGRNLSAGHGFVTYVLRPLALSHGTNALQQPDITHGPLYPFFLALAFGVLHPSDHVVAGVSAVFYLLTVPMIYLLGARMFSTAIGVLSALIFACNGLMLQYACSGLPLTLEIFLMTSLLLVVYRMTSQRFDNEDSKAGPSSGSLILAGILSGFLYLTDPIFVWVLPVIAGLVLWIFGSRRWQSLAVFAVPVCVLCIPWMVRNSMLTGNPVFGLRGMDIWAFTPHYYPGDQVYTIMPDDLSPGKDAFMAVVMKVFSGLGDVIQQTPQIAASWVLAFFLPSLFFRFADKAVNTVRAAALLCLGAIVVGLLPMDLALHMPVLTCLMPTLLIFSVAYVTYLVQQARLTRKGAALTFCIIAVAAIYPMIDMMFLSGVRPGALKEEASAMSLKQLTQKDDVSFSDQPWIVAWYADRPSVWIPHDDSQVAAIQKDYSVRWLFITENARALSPAWEYLQANFEKWNMVWQMHQGSGQAPVPSIRINANKQVPLFDALQGFTSVPPPPDASPTAVIATLPQAPGSTGSTATAAGSKQVAHMPESPGASRSTTTAQIP